MGHDHGAGQFTAAGRHRGRLIWVLAITGVVMVAGVVGAIWSGSLALLADAAHSLTDAGGVGLALVAITLATRPPTPRRTFGLVRAEILAAAFNALVLLGIGGYIVYRAIIRLTEPAEIESTPMLLFGIVGLVGNLISMALLMRAQHESLNMRGAFLEVLTDALGSLGVIIAAVVLALTGFTGIDTLVALAIGALIVPRAFRLLKAAVEVLLEATPGHIDPEQIRRHILSVPHVKGVHDLHAWTLTSGMPVLSAHVVVEDECFGNGCAPQVLDRLQECCADHFDVEHSTFQLEPESHAHHEHPTHT